MTTRTDPPLSGDEATMLRGFLDFHRNTLRMKTEGLDQAQLATALPPSTMTLGGLLKHLALVEDYWFSVTLLGHEDADYWQGRDWKQDPDWEWHSAADDSPEELRLLLDEAIAASDRNVEAVLAEAANGLTTRSVRRDRETGEAFDLRWILVHMIEEYARHNGHADLLRESIDGETGE